MKYKHMNNLLNSSLFAFRPLIKRILVIAVVLGIYYWLLLNNYFPFYHSYIEIAVKIIVAYELIAGSAQSILSPLLGCLTGFGILVAANQGHPILLASTTDAKQLMVLSLFCVLITIISKI